MGLVAHHAVQFQARQRGAHGSKSPTGMPAGSNIKSLLFKERYSNESSPTNRSAGTCSKAWQSHVQGCQRPQGHEYPRRQRSQLPVVEQLKRLGDSEAARLAEATRLAGVKTLGAMRLAFSKLMITAGADRKVTKATAVRVAPLFGNVNSDADIKKLEAALRAAAGLTGDAPEEADSDSFSVDALSDDHRTRFRTCSAGWRTSTSTSGRRTMTHQP